MTEFLCEKETRLDDNQPQDSQGQGAPYTTVAEIHRNLNVPELQATKELSQVFRQSQIFDGKARAHGSAVLRTMQWQQWLRAPGSRLLHVDGQLDPATMGKTSPVSYFCAIMVQVLYEADQSLTLHFFCGQHVASNDALSGPEGLIRSLVSQLTFAILQHSPGEVIGRPNMATMPPDGHPAMTEHLCEIFWFLLGSIPPDIQVFCLIDGISWFEKDNWSKKYTMVMNMLHAATSEDHFGGQLKVLLTSPTKSRWLRDSLMPSQHIELRNIDNSMRTGSLLSDARKAMGSNG
jgi:hypothetical protein